MAVMAWLVFFSRSASNDYQVHIALYEDLKHSVRIDFGILGVLKSVSSENKPLVTSPGHYVYPIICIRIPVFRKLISVDKRASGHWTRFGAGIRGIRFGRNCVLQREHQSNI